MKPSTKFGWTYTALEPQHINEVIKKFFKTKDSMTDLAAEYGVTKQAISLHINKFVKDKGLKFVNIYKCKCRMCGKIWEDHREAVVKIRKKQIIEFLRVKGSGKTLICEDCRKAHKIMCTSCGKIGVEGEPGFYVIDKKMRNYICKKCSNANVNRWVDNNRKAFNKYQAAYKMKRYWENKKKSKMSN